jgi:hypothetical protein
MEDQAHGVAGPPRIFLPDPRNGALQGRFQFSGIFLKRHCRGAVFK